MKDAGLGIEVARLEPRMRRSHMTRNGFLLAVIWLSLVALVWMVTR